MRRRDIAPLDQQSCEVSQEVVESLTTCLLVSYELANRLEPHRGIWLKKSAVID
jgi:hypothetical protein